MRNEKGEIYMQKVKVTRYVTGKRPDFAPCSDDDDDEVTFAQPPHQRHLVSEGGDRGSGSEDGAKVSDHEDSAALTELEKQDPRLQRLLRQRATRKTGTQSDSDSECETLHKRLYAAEILDDSSSDDGAGRPPDKRAPATRASSVSGDSESESEQEELDDDQLLKRRQMLRERALARTKREEELLELEDEKSDGEEDEDESVSEYEEYTDSEEETGPRLKPIFVRREDRVTIEEKEKAYLKQKQAELETKKLAEERRKHTLKMVESEIRKEMQDTVTEDPVFLVNTDDENDETAYEMWKLRELKRIKRDKEEKESRDKERQEAERMRNLTEEERRAELRANPKQITNKVSKGKYKFLQKYYHRGAFYLDEEESVLKRDHTVPTLEDKFDKTVLPKVMQVKNFGRSGRTKYTHLIDQDTTVFDSAWAVETGQNVKFFAAQAGGMKQQFERPAVKKQRTFHNEIGDNAVDESTMH